jgi:hypothetical protein
MNAEKEKGIKKRQFLIWRKKAKKKKKIFLNECRRQRKVIKKKEEFLKLRQKEMKRTTERKMNILHEGKSNEWRRISLNENR